MKRPVDRCSGWGRLALGGGAGLVLMLATAVAQAATLPKAEGWIELHSTHFHLISDASLRKTTEIALDLEQFRLLLARLRPGSRLQSPVPMRVIVFKGRRSFRPYKRWRGESDNLLGFFLADQFGNRIAINAYPPSDGNSLPIVYHEFTHFFMRHNFAHLPLWVDEGVAEYYSSIDQPGGDLRIGVAIPRHIRWLRKNSFIPLDEFFTIGENSPHYRENDKVGGFYAQSWALVHYLVHSEEVAESALPKLLEGLGQAESLEIALAEALGFPPAELEGRLRRYIHQLKLKAVILDAESVIPPKFVSTRALSHSEALVALGDLLAFTRAEPDFAEQHFRAALEEDPKSADAWAGLGNLARLDERFGEAAEFLSKAVELGSPSAETYVWLADLLVGWSDAASREAAGGEQRSLGPRARELLLKAREINPNFEEIQSLLASSYFAQKEGSPEAIAAMTRAVSAFPNRPELAYNLVVLYLRAQQFDEARRVIDERLRGDDDGELLRKAEEAVSLTDRVERSNAELLRKAEEAVFIDDLIDRSNVAAQEGDLDLAADLLRQAIAVTSDLPLVTQLTAQLGPIEAAATRNRLIERFNQAVALLNAGDNDAAKEVLEELEPEVKELNLRNRIRALLDGLR